MMQAPERMKSTIMSLWLLTTFAGNLLDAVIMPLNVFTGPYLFLFFAGLMLLVAAAFVWAAHGYTMRDYSRLPGSEQGMPVRDAELPLDSTAGGRRKGSQDGRTDGL